MPSPAGLHHAGAHMPQHHPGEASYERLHDRITKTIIATALTRAAPGSHLQPRPKIVPAAPHRPQLPTGQARPRRPAQDQNRQQQKQLYWERRTVRVCEEALWTVYQSYLWWLLSAHRHLGTGQPPGSGGGLLVTPCHTRNAKKQHHRRRRAPPQSAPLSGGPWLLAPGPAPGPWLLVRRRRPRQRWRPRQSWRPLP